MPGSPGMELEEASATEELSVGEVRAWRLWRRHPTHSGLSDAPTRSVLAQYEYLMLVDKAARAQALSRIVGSGLLVVAEEITIPGADSEDADEDPESDPFVKALTDHIITPISQPGSASAVAPLVMRVQMGEKRADDLIKLIQLHDPSQTGDWHTRIEKTITRIAIGLDMPPEEFLGLSGANHWTGWVITDEKWKAHGEPVTIRLCDDLTAAYFRPACIQEKVPRAEELIIWFDAAQVVTHPDRGKDANETHDRGALSDSALRRAHNFSDHDAPSGRGANLLRGCQAEDSRTAAGSFRGRSRRDWRWHSGRRAYQQRKQVADGLAVADERRPGACSRRRGVSFPAMPSHGRDESSEQADVLPRVLPRLRRDPESGADRAPGAGCSAHARDHRRVRSGQGRDR